MSNSPFTHEKRSTIRTDPWPDNEAKIDPTAAIEDFKPRISALVTDESRTGYSVVVLETVEIKVGDICSIKTGESPPTRAEVAREESLGFEVKKLGLKKLE